MNFDEWFFYQSKMIQAILLFIPVIGWIVEILVRISALTKNQCSTNIVGLVVYILIGWAWITTIVDMFYLIATDRLMFCYIEDDE